MSLAKFFRLPFALAGAFLVLGIVVFGLIILQVGGVSSSSGIKQAEVTVQQMAGIAGETMRQRLIDDMQRLNLEGTPEQSMLRQHMNAAMQSFPGQIIIKKTGDDSYPAMSISEPEMASARADIKANMSKQFGEVVINGKDYITYTSALRLTGAEQPDFTVMYLMPSEQMMKPYQAVSFRVKMMSLLGILFLALAGGATGYLLAQRLLKVTNTLRMAEGGGKPEPLSTLGSYEFAQLAEAVNLLLQGPTEKDKVRQQANTDALTGLLNRRGFVQAMDDRFKQGGNSAEMSVMFLDLDGFKPINDTYGHDVGDNILIEVAKRLGSCVREQDVICRLGGDEFVLLFSGLVDREVLIQRADRVLAQINEPYWIGDNRVTMGVSIGISIGPADGKTGEALLTASDEAMYTAKKTGKNQYTFYS